MNDITAADSLLEVQLQAALKEHGLGRFEQAEELYLQILQAQPYHAIANHNMGLLAGQVGQHQAGLPYLLKALSVNPDEGQFWLSYANGLLKAGQAGEALEIVETAIGRGLDNEASQGLLLQARQAVAAAALLPGQEEIDHIVSLYHAGNYTQMESATRSLLERYPESAFGWSVLGTALQIQGKDALPALYKCVELTPDDPEAYSSLGNALQSAGDFDAAIVNYLRALDIKPDFVEALSNMGGALQAQDLYGQASDCYQRALQIRPDYTIAHFNLGNSLKAMERYGEAAASYRAALALAPEDAEIHCNLGNTYHALEQYDDALAAYDNALLRNPAYVMAHGNRGAALYKLERYDEALLAYRQALQLAPYDAEAHCGLGQTLEALKDVEAALASYRSAITWRPKMAAGHTNMGRTLLRQGDADAAVLSYRKALALLPDDPTAHNQLALALSAAKQSDEAEVMHRRALELEPGSVESLLLYGHFLKELRRHDEAIDTYRKALHIDAADVAIHNAIGMALQADGKLDLAILAYEKILVLDPLSAIAYCNIGSVQQAQKQLDAARKNYERALEIAPEFPGAIFNLSSCQMESGQFTEAIASYQKAIAIEPGYREAHVNISAALSNLGRIDEAVEQCRLALKINPDWDTVHSNLLFLLSHSNGINAAALFAEHQLFAEQFEAPLRASWPRHDNQPDPERQLRIGFVSADFNNHAVAHFITSILENLQDNPRLELIGYYNNHIEDFITDRLRSLMSQWRQVQKMSHEELAVQIRTDRIDILIDLSGHSGYNRLLTFARKPAPLQISWMGYPGTTGLQAMDYYIVDRFFAPPGQFDEQFSEKLICLPSVAPFLPSHEAEPVSQAPAYTNGYLTFGSFNRANKLSRKVIATWSTLLRALPNAKMLVAAMPSDKIIEQLRGWFAEEGINGERLSFHMRTDTKTYLAMHRLVDVCLDTAPYNGGTTSLHAFWMGVPTLTITGDTLPSRAGAAMLEHVGMSAFVAENEDDFVKKGLFIADNIVFLATLRMSMRQRLADSAIGQPALIAAGLNNALRFIWRRWCANLPAVPFDAGGEPEE